MIFQRLRSIYWNSNQNEFVLRKLSILAFFLKYIKNAVELYLIHKYEII